MNDIEPMAQRRYPPRFGMIEAVKQVFRKAFVFSGRARRAEYWWFTLFYIIVSIVLTIIWSSIFGPEVVVEQISSEDNETSELVSYSYTGGWAGNIFSLVTLIPYISVGVRRLHDVNYRGWWLFLPCSLILVTVFGSILASFGLPTIIDAISSGTGLQAQTNNPTVLLLMFLLIFATVIYLLILLIRKGTPGPNRFGPNPIEISK